MKYPKVWPRDPNPDEFARVVAEARIRGLQQVDAPYLTVFGPNFEAAKKNQFAEAYIFGEGGVTVQGAYYSRGRVDSEDFVVGSTTAKRFRRTSRLAISTPGVGARRVLLHLGHGLGVVVKSTNVAQNTFRLATTYNGRKFTDTELLRSSLPIDSEVTWFNIVRGTKTGAGDKDFVWGFGGRGSDGTFRFGQYTFLENGEWVTGDTLREPGYNNTFQATQRVGPSTLVAATGVYGSSTRNLSFFSVSEDNGRTWSYISTVDDALGALWRIQLVSWVSETFQAAAYSPSVALLFISSAQVGGFQSYYSVLRLTKTLSGWVASRVATLDGDLSYYSKLTVHEFANPSALAQGNAIVAHLVPLRLYADIVDHKLILSFDGGLSWTYRALPWHPLLIGEMNALDEHTLAVTVYDGDHSLYQSKDFGETWTKRGVVWSGLPQPPFLYVGANSATLDEFALVSKFRDKNGKPVAASAGAPWVTDSTARTDYE